jgi:hypothetical protein
MQAEGYRATGNAFTMLDGGDDHKFTTRCRL